MVTNNRPAERCHVSPSALRLLVTLMMSMALATTTRAACNGRVLHAYRAAPSAPENPTSGVRQALEREWDGADIDAQQLLDQAWVLHHDPQLGRTTSLRGRSASQLDGVAWREVPLRDRPGRLSNEPPPLLADLLTQVPDADDQVLNVEIKQLTGSCDAVQQAGAAMQRGRPDGSCFMTAIDRQPLRCVRAADPRGYIGQIVLDPQALARQSNARTAGRVTPAVIDAAWLRRLQQEVGAPVGVHVDINMLIANPMLLAEAKALEIPVLTYHLGADREHAQARRLQVRRSGLLPSGAIIDGAPCTLCEGVTQP